MVCRLGVLVVCVKVKEFNASRAVNVKHVHVSDVEP